VRIDVWRIRRGSLSLLCMTASGLKKALRLGGAGGVLVMSMMDSRGRTRTNSVGGSRASFGSYEIIPIDHDWSDVSGKFGL
jgi:hypothetical protein